MGESRQAALPLDGRILRELTIVNSPRLPARKLEGHAALARPSITAPGLQCDARYRRRRRETTAVTREQMLVLVISCAGIVAALLILKLAGW
jgi:hypothetical protein